MNTITATYSPDDNKLRLQAAMRLDAETYARVKAAGFAWAPKQECFYATWAPGREDLALELAGQIDDDDRTLTDRAEERAERFEDYSDKRATEGERAQEAVRRLADGIPFGQPILVGHHSEKRARKDADRIHNGMRKAVDAFKTSAYWLERAQGAIRHAKHKERPDVRARRIKTIEAEARKVERTRKESAMFLRLWERLDDPASIRRKDGTPTTKIERARFIAARDHISRCFPVADYPRAEGASTYEGMMGLDSALGGDVAVPIITPEQAAAIAIEAHRRTVASCERWAAHYANRLAYERAMLAESGGTVADKTGPQVGGGCRCWASPRGGWSYIKKVNRVSVTVEDNWGNGGRNFTRTIPFDKLAAIMAPAEIAEKRAAGLIAEDPTGRGFYVRQAPDNTPAPTRAEANEAAHVEAVKAAAERREAIEARMAQARALAAVKVETVTAPQLFPTPAPLAARMVEAAGIEGGMRILEPSAGTGAILGAMGGRMFAHNPERGGAVAVEINPRLSERLRGEFPLTAVYCGDFLQMNGNLGTFDRILMNPPFANAQDVAHIQHARAMLKPGGRLVAICANGPRQAEALQPIAATWEPLPAGTFAESGTNVNAVLLTIEA